MELSKRLELISSMVDLCNNIIDVGTDHGYVPIYLLKNRVCVHAIASDINRGPVEKAALNIAVEELQDFIECRLGSGLSTVKPGEVDGAIIAGMGGNLIRDIIEEGIYVFKELSFAILQPVQNAEVLRKYIYESGYEILDEELCFEEDKFYEIIKVKFNNNPRLLDELCYEISPVLLNNKHSLIREFINYKLHKYEQINEYIKENSELALARKQEVEVKITKIKELLSCL